MKKLILTASMLILSLFLLRSQEGKWEWARLFQSSGAIVTDSWGMDICMDANNNVYMMGVFRAVPITIGTETLTNRGQYDIFICSFDATGGFRWARSIGSTGSDDIAGLVVVGNYLYVAGAYNGAPVYFTATDNLPNSNHYDSFIAQYLKDDGSFQGARRVFWGTNPQRLQDMTFDNFNNYLVVVGQFTNQLIYNNGVQDTTITPLGTKDFMVARFDLSGGFENLQFHDLKRFYSNQSGTSLKQVNLSVIGSNHTGYFISGDLYGTIWFSPTQSIAGKSATTSDALVFKMDNNLGYEWSRRGGGTAYDHVNSSGSDNDGNIYLAGKLEGQNGTFDSTGTQQSRVIKSVGAMDFHITKYNREGRLIWLYQLGYAGNDDAFGMAIQGNYLQVAGNMSDEGNINTGFIKLDLDGNYINQGEIHGDGEDVGKGVTFDIYGYTLITGYSNSDTLFFGLRNDPDTILVNTSGAYDGFLGKYQYPLTIVQEQINDVSCQGGNDGIISLRAEFGEPPYSWSWDHETNLTPVADSLVAGTYIVTLTDNAATIVKDTIEITEPDALLINRNITTVSCFNGSNGGINITPLGGAGSYTYFWSGGSGLNPTVQDQSNLSAGTYDVRITDYNNCWLDSTFSITQPTQLVIDKLEKWDVSPCSSSNGSAKVTISGGTPNYSYLWSNNGTADSIGSLSKGDYTVQVTDNKGCSITSPIISIIDSCKVNLLVVEVNDVSCNDGSDGSITLSAFGGQQPYTYSGLADLGLNDSIGENLSEGNYEIFVTDNIGDKDTIDVTIMEPSQLFSLAELVDVICFGECTGKINLSISGGTPPYSHKWSNSSTSEDLTNICFGNYSDTITDAKGCVLIKNYVILQNPEIKVTSDIDSVSCNGLNDGNIDITVSGGIPPYDYYWLKSDWNPINGLTGQDIFDLFAGDYYLKITDDSGCVKMDTLLVPQPDPIDLLIDSIKNSCPGRDDGIAWVHAIGGNGGNSYTWEPSGKTGNFVENMPPLCYDVTIVDKKLCSAVEEVCIPENPPISVYLDVIRHIVCEDSCDGAIYITTSGGTPPYEWLWYPDGETTEDIPGKCAGNHNVTVTDAAGCFAVAPPTGDYEIEDQSVHIEILRQDITDADCFGSNDGEIILKADGAVPFNYSINDGAAWQSDTLFEGLPAGTYIIVFKDANECLEYGDTLILNEPEQLILNIIIDSINATINLVPGGGTSPYHYFLDDTEGQDNIFDSLASGNYVVRIDDANGCTTGDSTVYLPPTGIKSISDFGKLLIYPNPTTGKLTVDIEVRNNEEINLEIVNLLGQVIWKKELQNNGQPRFIEVIDMSQQSKGTYFMRVNGLPVHTKILLE